MGLYLKNVTGRVTLPNGDVPVGGAVIFTLKSWDKDGPNLFLPGPVAVAIDAGGDIDADLQTTAVLDAGSLYDVSMIYFSERLGRQVDVKLGVIAVPDIADGASVRLADLLAMPAPAPTVPDALAQTLASEQRAKGYADGMTDEAERAEAAALSAAASEEAADESSRSAAASAQEAKDIAGSVGVVIATQPEAEAGANNSHLMTPLRSHQQFLSKYAERLASAAQVIAGTATNLIVTPASLPAWLSSRLATRAEAEAGTDAEKLSTPQKVAQYVTKWFAGRIATQAQALEGLSADSIMTPVTTRQAIEYRSMGFSGQTRQDVRASRQVGVVYQNTTGRPIFVNIYAAFGNVNFEMSSDQQTWIVLHGQNINNDNRNFIATMILPGEYYRLLGGGIGYWHEVR